LNLPILSKTTMSVVPALKRSVTDPADPDISVPKDSVEVIATGPVNIAVIKYWGKRDTQLLLPINSSISGTLSQDVLCSTTRIIASKTFDANKMWLNGVEVPDFTANKRFRTVVKECQERANDLVSADGSKVLIAKADWPQYKLHVVSRNNFPTAAGLASSASGYATLTKCLSALYRVEESFDGELSLIARQGSGSASRSLYGGWAAWDMGKLADGSDSFARPIAGESHWPEMRVLIAVVNEGKKDTSSTSGMQLSCKTSPLLAFRAENVVPQRMKEMEAAIHARDFGKFAELTMQDSNQFHATCLDTYPPIFYMNDVSRHVVRIISKLNAQYQNGPVAAYTFDAGPNACIYVLDKNMHPVIDALISDYDPDAQSAKHSSLIYDPANLTGFDTESDAQNYSGQHGVKQLIVTELGPGAQIKNSTHTF